MTISIEEDKTFERINFREAPLPKMEYENCRFIDCDFSNAELSGFKFVECLFTNCDLSLARLYETALRDVSFKQCKMLGLQIDSCNKFGLSFSFEGCRLDNSSFYKTKIRQTVFRNCQLHEADFTEADLGAAVFDRCDLSLAVFDHCMLEKADFRGSYNFSIDPETNRLAKARFSVDGLPGLLHKYQLRIDF